MNDFLNVFKGVLVTFADHEIDYMVVGSIASIMYGEPRLTNDMDLVVDFRAEHAQQLETMFPSAQYYVPPLQIISQEILNRGQFNLIHTNSGLKIDIIIVKKSAHSREEFRRRTSQEFLPNFMAYVATPEDVIVKKLFYFNEGRSDKHLRDIRGIIANTKLDRNYIERWVSTMNLGEIWQLI